LTIELQFCVNSFFFQFSFKIQSNSAFSASSI